MKKSIAESLMKYLTILFSLILVIVIILYYATNEPIWLTLSITFGVFLYHFLMRLIVGFCVKHLIKKQINYKASWFLLRRWESNFYKIIKIKKWKNKLLTYHPNDFSLKNHSFEELLQTMCISEICHELIIVLSYLPILLTIWFGTFWVFFITSILAGLIDLLFVFIQRFNRNRILKIIEHK